MEELSIMRIMKNKEFITIHSFYLLGRDTSCYPVILRVTVIPNGPFPHENDSHLIPIKD